jgi:hypothetical protein
MEPRRLEVLWLFLYLSPGFVTSSNPPRLLPNDSPRLGPGFCPEPQGSEKRNLFWKLFLTFFFLNIAEALLSDVEVEVKISYVFSFPLFL